MSPNEVQKIEVLQTNRHKMRQNEKLNQSIEISKQNRKLHDRLQSIHLNPKTELSRRIVCKSTFHPGAKNVSLRKV